MKLACATGLIGLCCCLSLHDSLQKARATSMPAPVAQCLPQAGTLAERNLNPLNVKGTGWVGQVGSDKYGHAQFCAIEYGIRAAAKVLRSYYYRHGIDTIRGIVRRFAEGNQKEYIVFLSRRMGVQPDESFDVVRFIPQLLRHMSYFESGKTLPDKYFAPYDLLS